MPLNLRCAQSQMLLEPIISVGVIILLYELRYSVGFVFLIDTSNLKYIIIKIYLLAVFIIQAHELGHNAGADHYGSDCSNWLMAPCGNGLGGFSEESKISGEITNSYLLY
jgi:hypothetical protein